MTNPFEGVDLKKFANEFVAEMIEKRNKKIAFLNSAQCADMVLDMKLAGGILDADDFSYFPDRVKEHFKWQNIDAKTIKLFLDSMSDSDIGEVANMRSDKTCPFNNFSFERFGITIDIMIGQGSSVTLTYNKAD